MKVVPVSQAQLLAQVYWQIVSLLILLRKPIHLVQRCPRSLLPDPDPRTAQEDPLDHQTRPLVFSGLCDIAHRDMIREGDGIVLNRDWRLRMLEFANNHSNYFAISNKLLAGMNGALNYKRSPPTEEW